MQIFFSKKCIEYSSPGHPESPQRLTSSSEYLKQKGSTFIEPQPCQPEDILLVHTRTLLERVKSGGFLDLDTPAYPKIYEHACLSAGAAIMAAQKAKEGEVAFSLMRPPGHHATRDELGGFCYFNNIAIAVAKVKKPQEKAVIIDFDCHHGNGTEDIFLGKKDVMYVSLHQSPLYPGTGHRSKDNCLNYPLPSQTNPEEYLSVFQNSLKEAKKFRPNLIGVSAGFDAYKNDPITGMGLEIETFYQIGKEISKLELPTFAILEGGYSSDLGECIYRFLCGLDK